jgi:hypothetical protein
MDSAQMVVALAMIGVGVGGWIGIGLSVLVLRGRFKAVAGAIFAFGGIAAAVFGGQFILPQPVAARMLSEAEQNDPAFKLLASVNPAGREAILRYLQEIEQQGGKAAVERELRSIAFEIMAVHGLKVMPKASDAAADGYVTVMAQYLHSTHERDPDLCYDFVAESRHGSDYGMSPVLYDQMFSSMQAVLVSADRAPDPLSDEEREAAQERLLQIWNGLGEGPEAADFYTGFLDGKSAATPEQRKGACLFTTRLYHRIAAQEQPMRAHLVKVFYE